MPDLLLELFSEEIPARMQARAAEDLRRLVTDELVAAGLTYEGAKAFATPRRLALTVHGLTARSADLREERKGPRVGAPAQALEGFLRGAGLGSIDEAEVQSDPKKGDFYVATVTKPGRAAEDIVAEVVTRAISEFPWPKSMRWGARSAPQDSPFSPGEGASTLRWVRPLRSILCTFGPETEEPVVVPIEVAGIAAGDVTYGHRFMAGPQPIRVRRFDDYVSALERASVVLDPERRRNIIETEAKNLAFAQGLELVEDPGLLDEVAGLVEWPVVLMGTFDPAFLEIPDEVIRLTIRANQKCFVLRDPSRRPAAAPQDEEAGRLTNRFLLTANIEASDGGKAIVAGNERVIAARLSDARFFWEGDKAVPLGSWAEKLGGVTFHEKLGTQAERVERIARLARELSPLVGADPDDAERAARLAKADLVTGMVGEFPELQGVMGRYYALAQGEKPEVAEAIRGHYRPQGPGDSLPSEPVSVAVALADKLDTLVGFWAIDEKPTGSKDPYALRRAALGVIRISLGRTVRLRVTEILERHLLWWLGRAPGDRADWQLTQAFLAYDTSESNEDLQRLLRAAQNSGVASGLVTPSRARIEEIQQLDRGFDPLSPKEDWIERIAGYTEWIGRLEDYGGRDLETFSRVDELGTRVALWVAGVRDDLLAFFADRLKVHLRETGARHDLIDAIFALPGQDDLLMIVRRVEALGKFLDSEDGSNLLVGYRRAANILRAEEKKDGEGAFAEAPDAKLISARGEPEEQALFQVMQAAETSARDAIAAENFATAMSALAELRPAVDAFFDKVTVNADDPELRANRLKLLNMLRQATLTVADFSKIGG